MRLYFSGFIFIFLLSGCSVFGVNSVEEANYAVIKSEDKFELRLYDPLVIVETYVEGDFDEAGDVAFKKLFAYISGENTLSSDIAMTAPVLVNQSESGKKIEMTAPVLEERIQQGWRYMFVLPAYYSMATAPEPLNEDVKLTAEPRKKIASVRFSGLRDERSLDDKIVLLNKWIVDNDLTPVSIPRWAWYNPPWTLPFMRRNEVMIEVE